MGWKNLFLSKKEPIQKADLFSSRQAIYKLAQSAEDQNVRSAAVQHIASTLSDEKKHAMEYGLKSLDQGTRLAAEATLVQFDPSECRLDQEFLMDVAHNAQWRKDRLSAIRHIADEEVLAALAICADDEQAGEEAVSRLTSQELIAKVAFDAMDSYVRRAAAKRVEDQKYIRKLALKSPYADVFRAVVRKLEDSRILAKIAKQHPDHWVRMEAMDRLDDPDTYLKAARKDKSPCVREKAVGKVHDQRALSDIAKQDPDSSVRKAAIGNLKDERCLRHIAQSDADRDVRMAAANKLPDRRILHEIHGQMDAERLEKRAAILSLATDFLRYSLPVQDRPLVSEYVSWEEYDRKGVVELLDAKGILDFTDGDAVDHWNAVKPSFTDSLAGTKTDRASFLVSALSRQVGNEHFRDLTYLEVIRVGEDCYVCREWGGTIDG
jgi:hypothetical protein